MSSSQTKIRKRGERKGTLVLAKKKKGQIANNPWNDGDFPRVKNKQGPGDLAQRKKGKRRFITRAQKQPENRPTRKAQKTSRKRTLRSKKETKH